MSISGGLFYSIDVHAGEEFDDQIRRSDVPEIYISTDIETDGPIPGPHSMLSFASAAYLADKTLVGAFAANLEMLPGASGDPKTTAWLA